MANQKHLSKTQFWSQLHAEKTLAACREVMGMRMLNQAPTATMSLVITGLNSSLYCFIQLNTSLLFGLGCVLMDILFSSLVFTRGAHSLCKTLLYTSNQEYPKFC